MYIENLFKGYVAVRPMGIFFFILPDVPYIDSLLIEPLYKGHSSTMATAIKARLKLLK